VKYSPSDKLETLHFEAASAVSEMESCNFLAYQLEKSEIFIGIQVNGSRYHILINGLP
jgi:hypothetical protein